MLPSLGARTLSAPLRIAVALTLGVGILPSVLSPSAAPAAPWFLVTLLRELTLGTTLALVISTPFIALDHAGRLLDRARGAPPSTALSLATSTPGTPLSMLMQSLGAVVFVSAGGHRGVLQALSASFLVVPPGAWVARDHLMQLAARWTAESLSAALTLGSAAWLALLSTEAVIALAVRLSPSLPVGTLSVPIRLLVPLAALGASVGLWADATRDLAARALAASSVP